ncbi:unnamed protein product [Larinioides sclopetarius]|uniref:Uncharacterized protein n=1 Tax=Larinioides sclopetarius TaxID=280406 RepID=A0AAV1ZKE7_9ARAC
MQMRNSPIARTPPKNLPNIPGITSPNNVKPKENGTVQPSEEKQGNFILMYSLITEGCVSHI